MATFIIAQEVTITRQEGDLADLVLVVPDILPLTGRTAKFRAEKIDGTAFIEKQSPDIVMLLQVITIPILPADTDGNSGKHRWELKVYDAQNNPITIGKGVLYVLKKMM